MEKEKLYLASTGKEVAIGEKICGHLVKDDTTSIIVITINDSNIPMLKEAGILVTTPPTHTTPTMSKVIERLARKLSWKPQKVEGYLNTVASIMPMAAFNMVAREIATMLDEKYSDHINKSERIYCISSLDGRIHEICKKHIKNYRNFAAFRSIDDAKIACGILRDLLKEMFKSGE